MWYRGVCEDSNILTMRCSAAVLVQWYGSPVYVMIPGLCPETHITHSKHCRALPPQRVALDCGFFSVYTNLGCVYS